MGALGFGAILQEFITVAQEQTDNYNQVTWILYQDAFANWVNGNQSNPAPVNPKLQSLDQTKLAALFTTWVNSGSPTGPSPVDISSCITMVDSTPLSVPPLPPPSTGILGPLLAPGQWAKLPNDPSIIGTVITVKGINYVLVGVQSPFGWFGVHWEKA